MQLNNQECWGVQISKEEEIDYMFEIMYYDENGLSSSITEVLECNVQVVIDGLKNKGYKIKCILEYTVLRKIYVKNSSDKFSI